MSKIKSFIATYPEAVSGLFILICVAIAMLCVQGCSLASFIQVDVPKDVKVAVDVDDLKKPITLAEVDEVWADWNNFVTLNTERFNASIEEANQRYEVLASIANLSIDAAVPVIGGFPGGAFILTALGGLTGLFMKRPGEDKRVAKEKEASYNHGIVRGYTLSANPPKDPTQPS